MAALLLTLWVARNSALILPTLCGSCASECTSVSISRWLSGKASRYSCRSSSVIDSDSGAGDEISGSAMMISFEQCSKQAGGCGGTVNGINPVAIRIKTLAGIRRLRQDQQKADIDWQ